MNDRFRFRAIDNRDWSDEKGKIYYDVQDAYDWSGGEPEVPATSFGCIVDGAGWIVEQCTGLKDKNGNLIYEGDIVELTDDDSFEKPIKTIVRWAEENACFGLFGSHNLYYGFSSYESDNFEVIGNIHENPELLEDK